MPMAAPKPCLSPRCTEYATKKGRCDSHQIKPKHGWKHTKNRHQRGYGNNWVKLRNTILRRDQYLCQICRIQGRYTKASQVDHIINKASGGDDSEDNLQAICTHCHDKKTLQERK